MPEHILSLSYGKDSMACFGACELLGWPIDRVVTAEVWATDTIPADLPPMVEFKAKADKIIKERWGIEVEHIRAKRTYEERFYTVRTEKAKKSPLVEAGWTEAYCRQWCEENSLLSPIYTTATRGGCWFCHNQGVGQLRLLRRNYPELWALMLKWDADSPVSFKADGHTVHDFDKRFKLEDEGYISADDKIFRWEMLDMELNMRWF